MPTAPMSWKIRPAAVVAALLSLVLVGLVLVTGLVARSGVSARQVATSSVVIGVDVFLVANRIAAPEIVHDLITRRFFAPTIVMEKE